jgi:serpin B
MSMPSRIARYGLVVVIVLLSIALAGCGGYTPLTPSAPDTPVEEPPTPAPGEDQPTAAVPTEAGEGEIVEVVEEKVARADVERNTAPDVGEGEMGELAAGNTAFAFDLYQAVRAQEGNLIYSPYSVSLALAMTYAGARGSTEQQMADTFHFTLAQERLHPAFNALDLDLARRGEMEPEFEEEEGQHFKLNVANAIWGQDGFPFHEDFLTVLAANYGAGLRLLDFMSQPEAARQVINDWVAEETEERIKDIVPSGAITPETRLVLANAIYFNASWLHPFDEGSTHDEVFHLPDGSEVTVPMMSQRESFGYARGDGYQAASLPYYGGDAAMIVVMPDEGRFEAFEASLDAAAFDAVVDSLIWQDVVLTMPLFEYETDLNLSQTLAAMGMPDAFSPAADFSGMSDEPLFISAVLHKAFVKVDESGTEAAAATVVIMVGAAEGEPPEPVVLTLDKPFIFAIYDRASGTVLFVGRVVNPAG